MYVWIDWGWRAQVDGVLSSPAAHPVWKLTSERIKKGEKIIMGS